MGSKSTCHHLILHEDSYNTKGKAEMMTIAKEKDKPQEQDVSENKTQK